MSIDALFVAANLIDVPHDQQLVGQRLERFQHAVESLGLQWSRDAQPEEDIEGPNGHRLINGAAGASHQHLVEQRQANGDRTGSTQNRATTDWLAGHAGLQLIHGESNGSVLVIRTSSLVTIAFIRLDQVPPPV